MDPEMYVIPATMAVAQSLRAAGLPARFAPLACIGLGAIFAVAVNFSTDGSHTPWLSAMNGAIYGASAAGFHASAKKTLSKPKSGGDTASKPE